MQKLLRPVFPCLFVLIAFSSAVAQTKGSEKEWQDTLAAAKKEGKVIVVGSPDPVMRNEIIPKFTTRYGIPVEFIAGRSSQTVARVETERAAGIYNVDVYLSGPDTTANSLYGEKLIDPLKPLLVLPEVVDGAKWKKGKIWFVDPEESYVVRPFSSVASLFFINGDAVKPDEMRAVKDLLNPKWKGKISVEDPSAIGAGANQAARFYFELGPDFVRKLYVDQQPVATRDRRQMTDWLARGTQPICIDCREDDVRPLEKEGFKLIEIFELAGLNPTINGSPWLLSVANKRPNPNAARVFINWILGREGLETYARGYGTATLRKDIDESYLKPGIIPKSDVKYFDDTDWKWVITGRKEYREKFWKIYKQR
ncbi:MAG TPA: extracellular solute-binding protein [Candidatus Binatia bacterium]|jgi:iron(III) transport system substrate-binding protein